MNKDCKYSKSPKVQRRLPRPGEQMSAKQTLIYACRRGRKLCLVFHSHPWELRYHTLTQGAMASFRIRVRAFDFRASRNLD